MQFAWLGIVACLIIQAPPTPVPELTVGEVLDRWDSGSHLIESYDLTIELSMDSRVVKIDGVDRLAKAEESFPPLKYRSQIFKAGPKRFGRFTPDADGHYGSELLYDGLTLTSADKTLNQFTLQQGHGPFGSIEYEDYETIYRTVYGTADRVVMSKERQSRLLPREGNLYVVETPTATSGSFANATWRVWIDPARNFMPRHWSQWFVNSGERVNDRDCELELAEVAPGVWAPVLAKLSVYNKNKQSAVFGKVGGIDTLTVDMTKSRFNVPIADDVFVMKVPNGATVVDRTRNVVYTQGASDPDAYLENLAKEGKKAVTNRSPGDRFPPNIMIVPDQTGFWTTGRILSACAVGAVVGVGTIAWRMRGRL